MISKKRSGFRFFLNTAGILIPVIVIIAIWFPLVAHYHVPNISITKDMADAGQRVPADAVLDEIERFFESPVKGREKLTASAEMILQGKVAVPGVPSTTIGFPFDTDDLDKNGPDWQLFFGRLSIPYLLLSAYEVSGRDDFLMAARDAILGFASHERSAWLPKGYLWNDHAVAERISVLAKFWKLYRNHPDYQSEVARDLFQLAARSAELLSRPDHFTFSTNHGVMQNLALWQICLTFPALPGLESYKQLAFERMQDQMDFYVNDEGVVLEHSAGYQKVGLKFMGMAFRYLTLLDMPIPENWKAKYQKAEEFYAQLLRPDGSLPMFGDTDHSIKNRHVRSISFDKDGEIKSIEGKDQWIPERPHSLYPVAGYAIWWNGLDGWPKTDKLTQTIVAWSYFPGHAHKHADEMSVLLWAKGHNWWTNTGYWPYGTRGRSDAVSWAGSNAPHLTNESTHSIRNTELISYGWSDDLTAIDLMRKGPNEYVARRQVIQVKPNLWIILDSTFGSKDQRTTTAWTTSRYIDLRKGEVPGSYMLHTGNDNFKLTKFTLTSEGADIKTLEGSSSPFVGWEMGKPAPAIVVEQPANDSWAAAIWLLQEPEKEDYGFRDTPFMENWKDPRDWQITLPFVSGSMNVGRKDDRVFLHTATGTGIRKELQLSEPPQISDKIKDIQSAYTDVAGKYPKKRYSVDRNLKVTYFIFFIFLIQEIFFFVSKRIGWKHLNGLRVVASVGWILVGIWVIY